MRLTVFGSVAAVYDLFAQLKLADGLISVDTATVHIAAPRNPLAESLFSQGCPHDIHTLNWDEVKAGVSLLLNRASHHHVGLG